MDKNLTVSEIVNLVDRFIKTSEMKKVSIEGEISNITYHKTGHLYFTLKDSNSQIKCTAFGYLYKNIPRDLKEGDKIKIVADISFYKPRCELTFNVEILEKMNKIGYLYEKLEELKKEYLEKGYFDSNKKKKITMIVKRLGVITAETGAAIRDIVNTTHSRDKYVDIFLYPVKVQGIGAKEEIVEAIKYFNDNKDKYNLDALIVGRGGGSIEDLWAFNEREVIEAIYSSDIFVVSAVGHETDTLLSDYVADLRASTPTQAAEKIIKRYDDTLYFLNSFEDKASKILENKYKSLKKELENLNNSYIIRNIGDRINEKRILISELETKAEKAMNLKINKEKNNIEVFKSKLNINNLTTKVNSLNILLQSQSDKISKIIENKIEKKKLELENIKLSVSKHSNEDILKKGYTITTYKGNIIKRSIDISSGNTIKTTFYDGYIESKVK
ncbi:exodeoxyribonuclease VII large subunit [Streptobacillus moniliformis]|uniref:exodeoxyribonuclease VII large subunit n=1 Tax=Streptobacillus moniliformis TaxID=34105 RepID=UPI0007E49B24|nr:exodeoxyribonuclease VII large subunit [Streptobacillus moniliformis]